MSMGMEGEISTFMMVWFEVLVSMGYCYIVAKIIPKGLTRLISFLPVVCLFLVLPLSLSSIYLSLTTAFSITWLANFKLLLLAFGIGPLSDPSLSLGRFLGLACFPIKIQQNPPPKPPPILVKPLKTNQKDHSLEKPPKGLSNGNQSPKSSKNGLKSPLNYATKALLLTCFLFINECHKEYLHPKVFQLIFCLCAYMGMEISLAMVATVARVMLGSDFEAQFDEPYLCTSLKDLWGHRWNLIASDILRSTVYYPVRRLVMPILGRKWAPIPAIVGTFLVSAFMHELMFYYVVRVRPTWGTTCFFLFHGLCIIVESALKYFTGDWRLHRLISGPLVFGFAISTFVWLVMPQFQMLDDDARATENYEPVASLVKDLCWAYK